ncbi:MAG: phenylacetate--CoA ligase family protein [Nitrososphaerota archaeon]
MRSKPSKLLEIRWKKFKFMLKYAYENVPFYHRKFKHVGIKPDDIRSENDLAKIPFTTKFEIQTSPFEDVVSKTVNIDRCIKTTTSGSTGIPLTVVSDRVAEDFSFAVWARAMLENGLRPLVDRMATIRHPKYLQQKKDFVGMLWARRRKQISVFDSAEQQLEILEDFKPDVIKGYSSSLAILADLCKKRGSLVKPRLVFTGADFLTAKNRALIKSAFGCELFDYYGCIEFSLLAWECGEHVGYHINVENVLVEFIKDGEAVAPLERGEIVCTSLVNYAMPLIRYRLGDVGVPLNDQCPCGRTLPLIKIVEGRVDDFLTTLDGRIISGQIFSENYPFEDWEKEGIKQFRVIQERRDKLTLKVAVRRGVFNEVPVLEKAKRKLQEVFGEDMNIEFQVVDELEKDPSGKIRIAISKVPVNWAASN